MMSCGETGGAGRSRGDEACEVRTGEGLAEEIKTTLGGRVVYCAHISMTRGAAPGSRVAPLGICSITTCSGTIARPSSTASWVTLARIAAHQQSPAPSHDWRAVTGGR